MVPKMQQFSWADLPIEILLLFLKKLYFSDVARFAAVCKSWRTAASESPHFQALQFPWLLLSEQPTCSDDDDCDFHLFSPVEEDQLYHLNTIPVSTCRVYGVSMGCIIMHHDIIGRHVLYDLLTNRLITSIPEPKNHVFAKVVLSSRPSAPNLILGAIADETTLAFCRPGSTRWSVVRGDELFRLQDIVFFNGLFWSVSSCGQIKVFKFDRMFRRRRMRGYSLTDLPSYHSALGITRHCFVKTAADELFLVVRYQTKLHSNGDDDSWKISVKTVQLGLYVMDTTSHQWERVKSLGDRMFILGRDESVCAAGSWKFARFGFRPNCIYFLDQFGWQEFCFGDKKIRPFSPPCSWLNDRPQIWFQMDV